jgi:hypothetical protein
LVRVVNLSKVDLVALRGLPFDKLRKPIFSRINV